MLHGVAKQLQDAFPWLLSVACAALRLALACRDASSEVPYMATFRDHLQQLHLYFHNMRLFITKSKLLGVSLTLGIIVHRHTFCLNLLF